MARTFQSGVAPDSLLAGARHYMEKDVATASATAAELGLDVSAFAPTIAYYGPQEASE